MQLIVISTSYLQDSAIVKRRRKNQMTNVNNLLTYRRTFPRSGYEVPDAHALTPRPWKRGNISIIVSANTTEFKRLHWQ